MLYECVDEYLESEYKIEQLSDSNKITFPQRTLNLILFSHWQGLSQKDLIMGLRSPIKRKKLSVKEKRDERVLLGNLYEDKIFLRYAKTFHCRYAMIIPSFQNFIQEATKPKRSGSKGTFRRGFYFFGSKVEDMQSLDAVLFHRSDFWRTQTPMYVGQGTSVQGSSDAEEIPQCVKY